MSHPKFRVPTRCYPIALAFLLAACSPPSQPPAAQPANAALDSEIARNFTIGPLLATALRDQRIDFANDNKALGVGRKPEEVAALLGAAGLPTDKMQLYIDPLLVRAGDRVLLFDTGSGSNFGNQTSGRLATTLQGIGIDRAKVTDIFLSHVHGDHVGGLLTDEGLPTYPNATIHLSVPEWNFLEGQSEESAYELLQIMQHSALLNAMRSKVATFKPGAEIIPGIVKAVEIKGHTPGHSGFLIGSGDTSLLYIGDALHHSIVSVQKPDWLVSFDTEPLIAADSRARLLKQSASNGQRIYGVHLPFPGLGRIVKRSGEFVWVAE